MAYGQGSTATATNLDGIAEHNRSVLFALLPAVAGLVDDLHLFDDGALAGLARSWGHWVGTLSEGGRVRKAEVLLFNWVWQHGADTVRVGRCRQPAPSAKELFSVRLLEWTKMWWIVYNSHSSGHTSTNVLVMLRVHFKIFFKTKNKVAMIHDISRNIRLDNFSSIKNTIVANVIFTFTNY